MTFINEGSFPSAEDLEAAFVRRQAEDGSGQQSGTPEPHAAESDPSSSSAGSPPPAGDEGAGAEGEPGGATIGTPPGSPTDPAATAAPESQDPNATPPATPPAAPAPSGEPERFLVNGKYLTQAEVDQIAQFAQFFAGLPQDQLAAIDGYLSGRYTIAPQSDPTSGRTAAGGGAPAATPPSPTHAPSPPPSDEEYLDPRAASDIAALRQELDALRSQQAAVAQSEAQRQQAIIAERINSSLSSWHDEHQITDTTERQALETEAQRSQLFPAFVQQYNGDHAAATRALMEHVYWQNPTMRQREVDRLAAERQAQVNDNARKQARAGAVSGSGSSAPRSEPVLVSHEDRTRAAVDAVRGAISTNGQN